MLRAFFNRKITFTLFEPEVKFVNLFALNLRVTRFKGIFQIFHTFLSDVLERAVHIMQSFISIGILNGGNLISKYFTHHLIIRN